jgi:hypothetical protein
VPLKGSSGQNPIRRMNPWLFWCPLLGGIAMMQLVGFLLGSHRVTAAGFFHFASTAAITFSLVYFLLSRYKKPKRVGRAITAVFSSVFLAVVLYGTIGAFYVVPFTSYNARHFRNQLEADLRSASTHANAYLSEHPQERINQEKQLRAAGWSPSPEVSFESANLTAKGGIIILKHKLLNDTAGGLKPGEGRFSTDGKDVKVEVPPHY